MKKLIRYMLYAKDACKIVGILIVMPVVFVVYGIYCFGAVLLSIVITSIAPQEVDEKLNKPH